MLTYSQELAAEKTQVGLNKHSWQSYIHYQTYYYRGRAGAVRVKSDVLTLLKEVDLPTVFHHIV